MTQRPFRFGVQSTDAASAADWSDLVKRAEGSGYSTLFTADHYYGPGEIAQKTASRPTDVAPITALAFAAAQTRDLRVGCRVFCSDFHHPVVLAKEMATLDMLSEGRLEVGLGAGWVIDEYAGLGVPMDRAGVRIDRLIEYVELFRAHFSGEQIDIDGTHVKVSGFSGLPAPAQDGGPPIMIGGGAPRILRTAGRLADIVSLNFNNASGTVGRDSIVGSGADQTDDKIGWVRDGAGDRFDQLELEIGAYFVGVGESGQAMLDAMAGRFGVSADDFSANPHALFGSVEQICDTLVERRERYGISYVTVAGRNLDDMAPVVARLAGT